MGAQSFMHIAESPPPFLAEVGGSSYNVSKLVLAVACQSNELCSLYLKLLINLLIKRSLGVLLFEERRNIVGYFDL